MSVYNNLVISGANVSKNLYDGDSAYNTEVRGRASLYVSGGAYASGATVRDNSYLYVTSRGAVNSLVLSSGSARISKGGVMSGADISSKSLLIVFSGGTAAGVNVSTGGNVNVDVYRNDKATVITGSNAKGSFSLSNGVASNFIIYPRGAQTIYSGAVTSDITVERSGTLNVSSGGSAIGVLQNSGAIVLVAVCGNDTATVVRGTNQRGEFYVSGGRAYNFMIDAGGIQSISSGGIADRTLASGLMARINVYSGGTITSATAANNASLMMNRNTTGRDVVILSGGYMEVYEEATVAGTSVWGEACFTKAVTGGDDPLVGDDDEPVGSSAENFKAATISGMYVGDTGSVLCLADVVITDTVTVDGQFSLHDGVTLTLDASGRVGANSALIADWTKIEGSGYTVAAALDHASSRGVYNLAGNTAGFATPVALTVGNAAAGQLTVGEVLRFGANTYTLDNSGGTLSLAVAYDAGTNSDLLSNGHSQIVGWDSEQGKVGFVATDGNAGPAWRGVWEWSGEEAAMWKVVGVGHFAGSEVDHDGILLYNGYGNTFAAWTNLDDPSYGYVSLCHVDGNFMTRTLTDLDGDDFDDVLIYDENGSFGVVLDAAEYHDIWHVDDPATNVWQLIGAGNFGAADGLDSLLVKKTDEGAYFLWHNEDPTFRTWNWSQTYIGSLDAEWSVAGIGDFSGDGTDDIAMWRESTGEIQIWEDGQASNQRYAGVISQDDWEAAAVGDYNGDGKEDLLFRELATGWGGLGYWASADATRWSDLNARVETDMESKFAIIA